MADVNGRPFLEFLMDLLIDQGCEHIILSTCYKKEIIRSHFGNSYKNVPVSYSEENLALGTGGSFLRAHKLLLTKSPFLIINGDSFFDINIQEFMHFFEEKYSDFSIALFIADKNNRYGRVRINRFGDVEALDDSKAELGDFASGGYFIAKHEVVSLFKRNLMAFSLEEEFLPELLNNGCKITGFPINRKFVDIGVPEDLTRFRLSIKQTLR